jgi:hypothetical protein
MLGQIVEALLEGAVYLRLLVEEFLAALVNVRIYASTHPRVTNSLAAVRAGVADLVEATGQGIVRLACVEGLLVFDKRPLRGASIGAARLVALLGQWKSSGIELSAEIDQTALHEFFLALLARPEPGSDYTQLNAGLIAKNVTTARLLPPYVDAAAPQREEATMRIGLRFYQDVLDLLQNVTVQVCRGGRIDFGPVEAHAERIRRGGVDLLPPPPVPPITGGP